MHPLPLLFVRVCTCFRQMVVLSVIIVKTYAVERDVWLCNLANCLRA